MTIQAFKSLLTISVLTFGLTACDKDDPWSGTHTGEEASFGLGKARTYITNDKDGNPIEIGVIMDNAAFDNFTAMSGDDDVSLDFPAEAGKTPFTHQYMGFAAHGHEPVMIYGVPHFDLHYYMGPESERMTITPFDTVRGALMPTPDFFPPAFFPAGLVPQMGVHWIDPTSSEFNGSPFTQTLIWGSFDNKVTFIEPMITRQFIVDNDNFEADLKQPVKYQQAGKFYPTKQGFAHDQNKGEYRFFFKGFVLR